MTAALGFGLPGLGAGLAAYSALTLATDIVGPPLGQLGTELRYQLGWNDPARQRSQLYSLQKASVQPVNNNEFASANISPVRLSIGDAIKAYNLSAPGDEGFAWPRLLTNLAVHGVSLDNYLVPDGMQNPQIIDGIHRFNSTTADWRKLIEHSTTAAPLGGVIHDYYRCLTADPAVGPEVSEEWLAFNFNRAGMRLNDDRKRLLQPFFRWSSGDAMRLRKAGNIGNEQYDAMLKASGVFHDQDREYMISLVDPLSVENVLGMFRRGQLNEIESRSLLALAGVVNPMKVDAALRFQWSAPSAIDLMVSAVRGAFDPVLAATYGLDQGVNDNPIVQYWMQAQGLVGPPGSPQPGPHDGPTDWMKYYWRGVHPVIGFATALELQWRCRPSEVDPAESVIPGIPAWYPGNTEDMLKMAGHSDTQIKWMMGLQWQPLNIRLINHVLSPYSTHADVRAAADVAFGPGVDWVRSAMLDHGFSPAYAAVASAGIRAQADDRYHAEKINEQKNLDKQQRDLVLKRYAVGVVDPATVRLLVVGEQFTLAMANQAMKLIDDASELTLAESHLAAIKEGYMGGKLSLDQVSAQMTALGISDFMRVYYVQEWTWKRADNVRMLSTGEILSALKKGLMSPQLALTRLMNLGWLQADALVEIAQVEQELALTSQHQQSAAAAKQIAATLRTQRAEAAAAKSAASEETKRVRAAKKVSESAARVPLETAAGVARYDAAALLDFDAYNKAVKAGDEVKAEAELTKAQAAYLRELLDQLKLRQENPGVANEVIPAKRVVNPSPPTSEGANAGPATPAQQPGAAPATGSGPGSTPGT